MNIKIPSWLHDRYETFLWRAFMMLCTDLYQQLAPFIFRSSLSLKKLEALIFEPEFCFLSVTSKVCSDPQSCYQQIVSFMHQQSVFENCIKSPLYDNNFEKYHLLQTNDFVKNSGLGFNSFVSSGRKSAMGFPVAFVKLSHYMVKYFLISIFTLRTLNALPCATTISFSSYGWPPWTKTPTFAYLSRYVSVDEVSHMQVNLHVIHGNKSSLPVLPVDVLPP